MKPEAPTTHRASGRRTSHRICRSAFSLVETVICTIIVVTMFAAGMAAAGAAARDRQTQRDIRKGTQLARSLMSEIVQQLYADPATNTIAQTPGISTTDRSNWKHIDDYTGFSESPPRDRTGTAIGGASGWTWRASVDYMPVSSPSGATGATGGLLGGLLGAVGGAVSTLLDTTLGSVTDTGLKKIVVTVTAPSGKKTLLTGLRCNAGAVDRTSTGFRDFASVNVTVGADGRHVTVGAPLLNTPAIP
jgi:type II secretory pathway pseudopilin PulG